MSSAFQKAERKQAKIKMAVTGPSGSGKTYSALLIAKGMAGPEGRIAVVDTENGSASLYAGSAGIPAFDVLELSPPFDVDKYRAAIKSAVSAKYDVIVVDSITHAWAGEGGLLDQKESLDRAGRGNSYTNWASITKKHEAFKSDLLQSDIHMICTMRSKQEYILQENEKGKQAPTKAGMAPIQRDGMEYEFTTVLDLSMSHDSIASKDRTGLFDGKIFKPTEETGRAIMKWLQGGKVMPARPAPVAVQPQPQVQAEPDWVREVEAAPRPVAVATSQAAPVSDPGAFVIGFGKHKGKMIAAMREDELHNYMAYLEEAIQREGRDPAPMVLNFLDAADAYLASLKGMPEAVKQGDAAL